MNSLSSEKITARRPDIFRALGPDDPPCRISVSGVDFRLLCCLKHDSWAATAVYIDNRGRRLACKFNRIQPLPGGLPSEVLGAWLAQREEAVMRELHDVEGFPRWAGTVLARGKTMPTAVAHWWVEGEPFRPDISVEDGFFPALVRTLSAFHGTGRAYVDMSKWGNILVGADGLPCLLDYQIHYRAGRSGFSKWLMRQLQNGDRFYLRRHWRRCRPDQYGKIALPSWSDEPAHIWLAERTGFVFRALRIGILRMCGVRGDPRKSEETVRFGDARGEAVG